MTALIIAWKDLQILFKNRGLVLQLFLLPLVFIIIFSGALSGLGQGQAEDARIALPVVNLDGGPAAQALLDGLEQAGGVRLASYATLAEAQALLDEGQIGRLLVIAADFSVSMSANQPTTIRLITHPQADAKQSEAARLVVEGVARDLTLQNQILASLQQMSDMAAGSPPDYQAAFALERTQAQARSQFERAKSEPLISLEQTVLTAGGQSQQTFDYSQAAVPGFTVLFVFLTAQATARSIYDEKKVGSFRRLLAAPLSKAALLAGKMLPNFITALVQMGVIFAFSTLGLRLLGLKPIALGPEPLAIVLVSLLIALCSSSLGLVIASLAHTERQINSLSSLLLWVMAIVGGSIVPLVFLELFLGPLPRIVPHYWANSALDDLIVRGLGLAGVTTELAALAGFSLLFFVIGLWRFDFD